MATLFNTKISATYPGLLKTIDNAALSATLRELSDGAGNLSGLFLNTAGDFKVTNILEWGSLKDTGTGVTITRFVTSTDGIENFDNNTSLPTTAAVKLYVDTKFATSDTLQEVLSFGNTTSGNDIVVSASDDIKFTDSSKALFGDSSDLQIFHDGSNSYINDIGSGNLILTSNALSVQINKNTGVNLAKFIVDGSVELYYNSTKKFETTNTGVTITGRLSGLTNPTLAQDATTKSYVDALDAGSDLDITDGTTAGAVNLNTQSLSILGTTNEIDSVVSGQSVTLGLPSTINVNVQGNLTGNVTGNVTGDLTGNSAGTHTGPVIGNVTGDLTGNVTGNLTGISSKINVSNTAVNQNQYLLQSVGLTGGQDVYADSNLYFNPVTNLLTVDGSGAITGDLNVTGNITGGGGSFLPLAGGTMTGNTLHGDNIKSIYGTGSDLEIYHDGSNSYINDTGTGRLIIKSDYFEVDNAAGTEAMIEAIQDGAVSLYYNASKKIETTNIGVQVSGSIEAVGGSIFVYDGNEFRAGDAGDLRIGHDATNSYLKNNTGNLYIDQAAVTESIFFRVSDANALDTTALTISRNADASFGRDVTIAGDLTVNGTTTTVNSQTLAVVDPLIQLAKDNTANSLDIGLYGDYNDGTGRYLGLFSDASDGNKFKLFKGTTVEPTTTVNIGGAGYVAADLLIAGLEATTISTSGTVSVGNTLYVTEYIQHLGDTNNNIRFQTGRMILQSKASGSAKIDLHDNGSLFLNSGGGTALTLDTSQNATFAGNVGIGGTPSVQLEVVGSTYSLIRVNGANTNDAGIDFGDADDNDIGRIRYENTDDSMRIWTNNAERLRIDSGGRVGVGFAGATIPVPLAVKDNQDSSFDSGLGIQRSANTQTGYINMVGGAMNFNSPSIPITFRQAGTEKVRIDSSGNSTFVGSITALSGTITGSLTTNGLLVNTSASGNAKIVGVDQAYARLAIDNVNGQEWNLIAGAAGASNSGFGIYNADSGQTALQIDSSGNSTFAGSIGVGGIAASGGYMVDITPSGGNIIRSTRGTSVFGSYQSNNSDVYLGTISSNTFKIITNDTTAITIDNSQNATFAAEITSGDDINVVNGKLTVNNTSAEVRIKSTSDTGESYINFSDPSDINPGQIYYGHSNNTMVFRTNDVARLRITAQGEIYNEDSAAPNNNTYYGHFGGYSITSGTGNTTFGSDAGPSVTTGIGNNYFGHFAGQFSTTGSYNVGIGQEAIKGITTGGQNVAIGRAAGTLGDFSETVLVGALAGYQNTQGATVGIGNEALKNNTGIQNTAVGHRNLINNTSGARNTTLGFRSLDTNVSGNDNTAIGNETLRNNTGSRNTAVGDRALLDNTDGSYNTAVGMAALKAVTSGTFNVGIGYDAYQLLTTSSYNTGVGTSTGTYQTGNYNTSVGYNSNFGVNGQSSGDYNTMVGYWAGKENRSENNTCLGALSGRFLSTGTQNTIVGSQACDNNVITGSENVVLGFAAAQKLTSGAENTILGAAAGLVGIFTGSNNVLVGRRAGYYMNTGHTNTIVGHQAGYAVTTGYNNTIIGKNAASAMTTGAQNVMIGISVQAVNATNNNSIVIGSGNEVGKGSNTGFISANGGSIFQGDNNTTWSTTSDERIKKNIIDNNKGLEFINKIQIRNFEYRTEEEITDFENPKGAVIKKQGVQLGVIAQEIEKVLPELVEEQTTGVKTVNSDNLTWYLINAVKELKAEVDLLKKECKCKN